MSDTPHCRFCRAPLTQTFVDLGLQPISNDYLTEAQFASGNERVYPLHARVCAVCFLVQADDSVPADEIFDADYAYFSSYSTSWVEHARRYAEAMHHVAVVDVEDALTAESPAAAMHAVVVGTVMVDPVLLALRRVAQEAVSAQRA